MSFAAGSYHQDNIGDTSENVDQYSEELVEPAYGVNALLIGDAKENAQGKPHKIGEKCGNKGHVYGLPYAKLYNALVPELCKQIVHFMTIPFRLLYFGIVNAAAFKIFKSPY